MSDEKNPETTLVEEVVVVDFDEDEDQFELDTAKAVHDPETLPDRIGLSGTIRRVVHVPRSVSPHRRGEPTCSASTSRCVTVCFTVPSKPRRYWVQLDGGPEATEYNPESVWFNTNFGGNWARFKETVWTPLSGGWYKICFVAKNWKHDRSRVFVIEIAY